MTSAVYQTCNDALHLAREVCDEWTDPTTYERCLARLDIVRTGGSQDTGKSKVAECPHLRSTCTAAGSTQTYSVCTLTPSHHELVYGLPLLGGPSRVVVSDALTEETKSR